ncbi:glutaredoxin 3 [Acidithiobacillus thiooxidans]|uniref:glutaredoxin 3 n=1 Tax=Acidithiobacillus thiooxidans TaxID=930 RepID=UPI001C078CE0|nr:glutaredoxin 3 [Acidithiobacillus thiooxidans]MBU2841942.1 glutaredoxin 3 [Acidithiobacillus thiooxidans]
MKVAAEVLMYATGTCPYCHRAEALLRSKGVNPQIVRVDHNPALRREMQQRAHGRHTVPQIFINGQHVGGSDDLAALNHRGALDALLQSAPQE